MIRVFLASVLKFSILRMDATKMRTLMVEHVEPSLPAPMYSTDMQDYKCAPTPAGVNPLAVNEIGRAQESGCLLIPRESFLRLIREIAQDFKPNFRLSEDAGILIQYAAESGMVELLTVTNMLAVHAGRIGIMPKDLQAAAILKFPWGREVALDNGRPSATVPKVNYSKSIKGP